MSALSVTKTRFAAGVWEGLLRGGAGPVPPSVEVTLAQVTVEGVTLAPLEEPGDYLLRIPVPVEAIGDGIHTFVIRDRADGETLDHFAVLAGEALADTLQAELDLMREELDLLKRAFRKHCVETS